MNILDFIWQKCIFIVVILVYVRKIILTNYGHPFQITDMKLEDGKKLKEIIKKEEKALNKKLYITINVSIKLLFLLGIVALVLRIYIYEWPVLKPGEIRPGYEYLEQERQNRENNKTNETGLSPG